MRQYFRLVLLIGLLLSLSLTLPLAAQEEMPLAARGSYHVGGRVLTFVDEERDERQVQVWLWYPAVVPEDRQEDMLNAERLHMPIRDVAPDTSGAPYPLVLYSYWYRGYAGEFNETLEPLVSRGYVVANLTHPNDHSALTYIDRPLDILFTINQLAALNEETGSDLAGLMNTDQIGVMGADDGADAAMMLTGARVDPQTFTWAFEEFGGVENVREWWYPDWDWTAMTAYHDRFMPPQAGDPLWPAMTDPRIRAVVAYDTYEGGILLGERGLASAAVPTLLIGQTWWGGYEGTAVAYQYSGAAERYLVSLLVGDGGIPIYPSAGIVQQFVTAFFGYHLQEKAEYAEYLTQDYAESLDNVVWGIDESAINNPRYISEMTFTDGGTVAVGDTIAGEIAERGIRMGYNLTLEADATLNFYANAAYAHSFDPVLYVCDAQGDVLFWNDELNFEDEGIFNAGLEGIALPAGSYTIVVSGFSHRTGSYELVVESAE